MRSGSSPYVEPMRPLTNEGWGFTSNCFVCEPKNGTGLRIPFHHDEERDEVVAEFELDEDFSGAPTYLHGGITLAVLDEAMAWAAIAVAGKWAVTKRSTAEFERPVRVGKTYRVVARIDRSSEHEILASATILDHKDRACTTATGVFTPLGAAQAAEATGADVTGANASFVRGGGSD